MKLYFIPTNAAENTCLRKTMIVLNTKKGKVPTGFFMTHQSINYMRKSRGSGSLFQPFGRYLILYTDNKP